MIFTIVTRTTGENVGINILEVLTITPNSANTNCEINFGAMKVDKVIGSLETIVNKFNVIVSELKMEFQTTYSRRVTGIR